MIAWNFPQAPLPAGRGNHTPLHQGEAGLLPHPSPVSLGVILSSGSMPADTLTCLAMDLEFRERLRAVSTELDELQGLVEEELVREGADAESLRSTSFHLHRARSAVLLADGSLRSGDLIDKDPKE